MPINLTKEQFVAARERISATRPPAAQAFEVRLGFAPSSFNLSGNDDLVVLRLVDERGMLSDVSLTPTVTIDLVRQLEKILERCDWVNTNGEPSLKTPATSVVRVVRRKMVNR